MSFKIITEPAEWVAVPKITGTPNTGEVLTCVAPGFTSFQWYRAGVAIPDATSTEYTVTSADQGQTLFCRVGRDTDSIFVSSPVILTNLVAPAIVSADVGPGSLLLADHGTWTGNGPITYTYRWLRCDATGLNPVAISAATADSYTVTNSDLYHTIKVEVTATDSNTSVVVTSPRTGKVSALMRGAVIVASKGNAFGQVTGGLSDGTELARTYGIRHHVGFAASSIRLLFGNFAWGIDDAAHVPAQLSALKASVKYGGVFYPVSFSGVRTTVLNAGGCILSDPINITVAPGDFLFSYSCPTVATLGQKWAIGISTNPTITGEGSATGDVVDTGAVGGPAVLAFSPIAVCADTPLAPQPVVTSIGTSIDHGVGDPSQFEGFITRSLETQGIGVFRQGYRSQAMWQLAANMSILSPLWAGCTHALLGDAVNDFGGARTLVQAKASLTAELDQLLALGVKCVVRTTTPDSNSTDAWATTTNQTPRFTTQEEADRVAFNTWVRNLVPTGLNPHAAVIGVFESADTVESARGSGKWKAPGPWTTDGVHPNSTGHAALAAALDTTLFTAT